MSTNQRMATARWLKTPRIESSARAGEAFEPKPAALMGQHSLRVTGRARGALAIDVPRTLAATPCGWSLATTAVEQGPGTRVCHWPLLRPEGGRA